MYGRMICLTFLSLVLGIIMTNIVQGADPGLVAWYRLDGDATDSSGNNLAGTEQGDPTYEDGVFGQAMNFDGDGDYVDCGNPPELNIPGPIAVLCWIKVNELGSSWQGIVTKGDNTWRIARNGGSESAAFHCDLQSGRTRANGSTAINDGEWHHLAGVYDEATVSLYLDGEVDGSGNGSGPIQERTDPVAIGENSQATGRFWNGLIDDVLIFSRALSQDEVQRFMLASVGDFPIASNPSPPDGGLHPDTWVTLSWKAGDFAVSHDVYLGDSFDAVNEGTGDTFRGNQGATFYVAGFPGFAFPDGLVPGTTYYWRIDEVNDADPNSPWKGDVWSFSVPPKTAYNPEPADGAQVTSLNESLSWTAGFGAKLHTIYFGDDYDTVANATVGTPSGTTTYDPSPLEAEKVYYWRVDEFDGIATYKGDVWVFTTPGAVGNPQPTNGADDVSMAPVLSWTAAENAASHEVYLGLDKDVVRSADTTSLEYKGSKALGAESFDTGLLEPDTTYYWRIDEVYNGSAVKGPVWSFTVGAYLLVDDFESYTDDDAAGGAIWQTWIDGFGIADNGAQVGYLLPPYAEQTTVNSGAQSMPLMYVNEAGVTNSEASMTLTAPRDWTMAGVAELSIWFRGGSDNAADPLYAAISNSAGAPALVANEDPGAATTGNWVQWRIALQTFADQGINLSNVDTLMIGLGSKGGAATGGTGTIYIDDIRLSQ